MKKEIKILLEKFAAWKDWDNGSPWSRDEQVLFHELYLIGFLDKPYLTKKEEYDYYDMGKPNLKGLIESRLQNKSFREIDDDYLEN